MTVTIFFDNVYCYVKAHKDMHIETERIIKDSVKYHPKGYKFSESYKRGFWDGYKFPIEKEKGYLLKFKIGLLNRVEEALKSKNYKIDLVKLEGENQQNVEFDKFKVDLADWIKPMPHQQDFMKIVAKNDDIFSSPESPPIRGVVCSPTGTGKTVLIGMAIAHHGRRSLIVVSGKTLLSQLKREIQKITGVDVAIIGDGKFDLASVVVATAESLSAILGHRKTSRKGKDYRRPLLKEWIAGVEVVFQDECHLAENATIDSVFKHLTNCRVIYGMSATPYKWLFVNAKSESILLEQHFGQKMFDTFDRYNFIEMGLHVPLEIYMIAAPIRKDVPEEFKTYAEAIEFQVTSNSERSEFIMDIVKNLHLDNETTFVYFSNLDHIDYLVKFWDLDCELPVITGSTSTKKREEIYKKVREKEILTFLSDVGGVGLDIKNLDNIVLASCERDVRQLKGRVQRFSPGKTVGKIYDFVDEVQFLNNHARQRYSQYKKDKHLIRLIGVDF